MEYVKNLWGGVRNLWRDKVALEDLAAWEKVLESTKNSARAAKKGYKYYNYQPIHDWLFPTDSKQVKTDSSGRYFGEFLRKESMKKDASFLKHPGLHAAIGGILTPLALDYRMNDDPNAKFGISTIKDLFTGKMSKDRMFNVALNGILGGAGGGIAKKDPLKAAELVALAPMKDLILNSLSAPSKVTKALEDSAEVSKELLKSQGKNRMLLGALGVGALGLGGLGLAKYLRKKENKEGAKMRLKLPGKKGDPDSAAEVEIPINTPMFAPSMSEGLDKIVRLRTKKNIRANSMKRDPQTGKLIPYDEWKDKYGNQPAGGVPLPENTSSMQIPMGMQAQLGKAASTREDHEQWGSTLSMLAGGLLGGFLGHKYAKSTGGDNHWGTSIGAAMGAALPGLLGIELATKMGKRTAEEQAEHDKGRVLAEYLIPGYADYQKVRRKFADEGEKKPAPAGDGFEDEDEMGDMGDDEDMDFEEKDASAPPPGGGGGGGGGQPPKPIPGGMSRKVQPQQNRVAAGLPQPGNIEKARVAPNRAIQKLVLEDLKPKMQQKQPVSLTDLPTTMSDMSERLTNLRMQAFGNMRRA